MSEENVGASLLTAIAKVASCRGAELGESQESSGPLIHSKARRSVEKTNPPTFSSGLKTMYALPPTAAMARPQSRVCAIGADLLARDHASSSFDVSAARGLAIHMG